MKKTFSHSMTILIVTFCGLLGWRAARDLGELLEAHPVGGKSSELQATGGIKPRGVSARRDAPHEMTEVGIFPSCEVNQVILKFPSAKAYTAFTFALAATEKIHLVDQLEQLHAVRLSYEKWADLSTLLHGQNIAATAALPTVPAPIPLGVGNQTALAEFGDGLLPWLGITGDNSQWGAGVKIAVLDTGIVAHSALPRFSESIALTPFPADLNLTNGHGTAVASLIAGNDPAAPGIAPAAQLISIRIGDEAGRADSFALAAGILAAIDSGADIINISMGTTENNSLIEDAVNYAHQRNVVIVAAAGNAEQSDANYPAAYPTVISVGAVDARGEHLDFSNYGTYLSLTAPGYALDTAWPGNQYSQLSGTSASAPIVTGAIAATMSSGRGVTMTASQAADIVMKYSNDAGIPGPDSEYGVGILDVGRVMNRDFEGIQDVAITNQRIMKSSSATTSDAIQVTVQNRGTAVLVNTQVELRTPFGSRKFNAKRLIPGEIQTFSMSVRLTGRRAKRAIRVSSVANLSDSGRDLTPENNQRSEMLLAR
jgi:subtilisin family serine protease